MPTLILLLAFALNGFGADEKKPRPKLPLDAQSVYDLSFATPPEFAANALLRLVVSGKVPDPQARHEIVDLAFQLAARAQHPNPVATTASTGADTRAALRASALKLGLDAITLQSRAVEAMLGVDAPAARELFRHISKPVLPTISCEDTLVPDLAPYFEIAGRVARETFTPAERDRQEHVGFITSVINGVTSNAELPLAAQLIATLDWKGSEFPVVVGVFSSKLDSMPREDRAFSAVARSLDDAVALLAGRADQMGAGVQGLLQTYRKYLVSQLTGARCVDNAAMVRVVQSKDYFELFGESVRGELPALTVDEVKPAKVKGEPKVEPYWQSGAAKRIFEQCMRLRATPEGRQLSPAERATREWRRELSDFLNTLAGWRPSEEASEADFYHQTAIVYEALLELARPGDTRDRVQDAYVAFLKSSNLQQQDSVEWYWHVNSALNRLRTQSGESAKLLERLKASGSPILALRALLDEVAPDYTMFPK